MIRVLLPQHLATLAGVDRQIAIDVASPVTQRSVVDALEKKFPMLRGTIRDHRSKTRRPFIRFFACGRDLSHEPPDNVLPSEVIGGKEAFLIIGAMAGG